MGVELGPLLPEAGWTVFLPILVVLVVVIMSAIVIAARAHRSKRAIIQPPQLGSDGHRAIATALTEVDDLLAQGYITHDEYSAMRSRILDLR